jgi:hypothetical protein
MEDYPGQIDWNEHPSPAKWFAVPGNPSGHTSSDSWTLSPDPNVPGWSTDAGCGGYGLPREVAEALAQRLCESPEASLARAADQIAFAGHQLATAHKDLEETEEALRRLASPRPWHYVTEKLPKPGLPLRLWVVGYGRALSGEYTGPHEGRKDRAAWWANGCYFTGGQVYAWEPEPEPPPLPEALPTADEVYGILSPAHPENGGPGFDQDGKEAAGPPRLTPMEVER